METGHHVSEPFNTWQDVFCVQVFLEELGRFFGSPRSSPGLHAFNWLAAPCMREVR